MNKRLLFWLLFFTPFLLLAQKSITGKVLDEETGDPLAYASVAMIGNQQPELTNLDGTFEIKVAANDSVFQVRYIGYQSQTLQLTGQHNYTIPLKKQPKKLNQIIVVSKEQAANQIMEKVLSHKPQNDPDLRFQSYSFQAYNKLIIDDEGRTLQIHDIDSSNTATKSVIKRGRAYLSEQISRFDFQKKNGLKQTVKATRTAGFEKPVYELLSLNVQSSSWYKKKYTVFGTDYAGPLDKHAFTNYSYEVLDTTQTNRPAYVIYFKPKRENFIAGLEGVLYIDTLNYGVQKAIGELKGEITIKAKQDFTYYPDEDIWFPQNNTVTIKPGEGGKKVSIFGGSISLGSLPENEGENRQKRLFLQSATTIQDIKLNPPLESHISKNAINLLPNAADKTESYWQKHRTLPFTERDKATFARVDSIIKSENINRRIEVIQKFNNGYYPLGFFDVDLRTLIKVNNYEGFRLGAGGVTNERFSKRFRFGGYGVYGFKDKKFKYKVSGGLLLRQKSNTWFDLSYTDDVAEVGSFTYLTDLLVYSLFEPRLVNINFYYKYQSIKAGLESQIGPKLISQWQLAKTDIQQTKTKNYRYLHNGKEYSDYQLTEATVALRWSPFSKFLDAPTKSIEIEKGYPKFSLQITQAFDGFLNGDFNFTKIGGKINYTLNRLSENNTEILLEGDYGFGDIPLTHSFHAYPNSPQKETIIDRFSVAGRRSFETMYFSEFFSDKLATLQIKHRFRPFDFGKHFQPELVLITRHAIGDMSNQNKHLGLDFKTLDKGYSESGFEINKLLFGFGLSFAYRYGAYSLPEFEDNVSFKFTFYLKL